MDDSDNHEKSVCTNHDFVHKLDVDPPPVMVQQNGNETKIWCRKVCI